FHLRIFQKLLDPFLVKTGIISKDEETLCRSTKRMQMLNKIEITYRRRIDFLITTDLEEEELCSIELKKTMRLKHLNFFGSLNRAGTVLNNINLLTQNTHHPIVYLDFPGRSAYIVEFFR
ncbi:hypothetical protein BD770DRAFT_464412, partial [Pilaira anomala]